MAKKKPKIKIVRYGNNVVEHDSFAICLEPPKQNEDGLEKKEGK